MPPPAPAREATAESEAEALPPPPGELPLGTYGLCFNYGLTYGFGGWQSVVTPTTIVVTIAPGNQYAAEALGNNAVVGSFAYDPATGDVTWFGGSFEGWPSRLHVDQDGRNVLRIQEVSEAGVATTFRCPQQ